MVFPETPAPVRGETIRQASHAAPGEGEDGENPRESV